MNVLQDVNTNMMKEMTLISNDHNDTPVDNNIDTVDSNQDTGSGSDSGNACSNESHLMFEDYHKQFYLPMEAVVAKSAKRPGRPPKQPKIEAPPAPGILTEPQCVNNIVEFETQSIKPIKQMLTFVHTLKCFELQITFKPHEVLMTVPFADGSIVTFMHLSAERTYSYYIKKNISVYVEVNKIKRIFVRAAQENDRVYIEQPIALLGTSAKVGVRRGNITIETAPIETITTEANFDVSEIDFQNYPVIIQMRAAELKSILKENDKTATCLFIKELGSNYARIKIKTEGSQDRDSIIANDPAVMRSEVISNTSMPIVLAEVSINALTKTVMHPPTDFIRLYLPPNTDMPFICVYKDDKMCIHVYIKNGSF